jgi:phage anti-repressor protein
MDISMVMVYPSEENHGLDQVKLMLDEVLTPDEKALYAENFRAYLAYGDDDKSFVVDLDDVYQWMGFTRKDTAKSLIQKKLTQDVDYICVKHDVKSRGGHNKQQVLMNVDAFKRLCIMADTEKSKQVQMYYLKLEKIFNRYNKMQYEQSINKIKELEDNMADTKKKMEQERHDALVIANKNRRLVYIIRVMTLEDNQFVIKIGSTTNVQDRHKHLCDYFGLQLLIMHVFPCDLNLEFEAYLRQHKKIKSTRYEETINNKVNSNETYLMKDENMLNMIVRIAQKHVKFYQSKNMDMIQGEVQNNKVLQRTLVLESVKHDVDKLMEVRDKYAEEDMAVVRLLDHFKDDLTRLDKILNVFQKPIAPNNQKTMAVQQDAVINHVINDTVLCADAKPCGPKVQVYDPKDLTKVVNVYEGITEATRQVQGASFTQIKKAASERMVYQGYRWHLIDRSDPKPDSPKDIGPTVDTKERKVGYVAMMTQDRKGIVRVFVNQKLAADHISQHPSAICTAVKYGSQLSNHYWSLWDDLDQEMRANYLMNNTLPEKDIIKPRGTLIQRLDPETKQVLETLGSITDVCKKYNTSPKTLKAVCKSGSTLNGYLWTLQN